MRISIECLERNTERVQLSHSSILIEHSAGDGALVSVSAPQNFYVNPRELAEALLTFDRIYKSNTAQLKG